MNKEDIRILLIDDEDLTMGRIRRSLSNNLGYSQFQETVSCSKALKIIHNYRPHLVFIDTEMAPDGFETYRQIKETYKENIGIIGISSDENYREEWLKIGADGFLSKLEIVSSYELEVRKQIERVINKALEKLVQSDEELIGEK